jgi:hypothetical protein
MEKCFSEGKHFKLKKGDPGYKNIKGVRTFLIDPEEFRLLDKLSVEERKRRRNVFKPKNVIGATA